MCSVFPVRLGMLLLLLSVSCVSQPWASVLSLSEQHAQARGTRGETILLSWIKIPFKTPRKEYFIQPWQKSTTPDFSGDFTSDLQWTPQTSLLTPFVVRHRLSKRRHFVSRSIGRLADPQENYQVNRSQVYLCFCMNEWLHPSFWDCISVHLLCANAVVSLHVHTPSQYSDMVCEFCLLHKKHGFPAVRGKSPVNSNAYIL